MFNFLDSIISEAITQDELVKKLCAFLLKR